MRVNRVWTPGVRSFRRGRTLAGRSSRPGAWVLATVVALGLSAGTASAQTKVAEYATAGCDGATTWRVGVRIYEIGDEKRAEALKQFDEFVQNVGRWSQCGVRIQADVFSMDGVAWGNLDPGGYPVDADAFRATGYDTGFFIYPARGEDFVGETNYRDAKFPAEVGGQPYLTTFTHEWLHEVVHFYDQANWPAKIDNEDIVHTYRTFGAYPSTYDGVIAFFADVMVGRVGPAGYGMKPDQWAFWGTPRAPLNLRPVAPPVTQPVTPQPVTPPRPVAPPAPGCAKNARPTWVRTPTAKRLTKRTVRLTFAVRCATRRTAIVVRLGLRGSPRRYAIGTRKLNTRATRIRIGLSNGGTVTSLRTVRVRK